MKTEPEPRLQAYLGELYHALPDVGQNPLTIRPRLHVEEAEDFLDGLEAGLFSVDCDGYVQSPLLPPALNSTSRQEILQIFWHWRGRRVLFREGVCQLAAASSLVLEYGWGVKDVRLEPSRGDLRAVAYGVDLAVREPSGGRILICGEVKRDTLELKKLLDDLTDCFLRGSHPGTACNRKNHPKFQFCRHTKAEHFWAVCPGIRRAFRIEFVNDVLNLRSVEDIPTNPRTAGPSLHS